MADSRPRLWFQEAPDVDYYAALNVPRDASMDDIRKSFFALSREFHPDKTKHKEEAHQQYPRLDRAYKVLSSPSLRLAYDNYGERGVIALEQDDMVSHKWSVGAHVVPDAQIQERLLVLLRRWNEKQIQAQFPSHTECIIDIDAMDFVRHPRFAVSQVR